MTSRVETLQRELEEAKARARAKIQGRYDKALEKLTKANAEGERVKDEQDRVDAWGERVAQKADAAQAELDVIVAEAEALDFELNLTGTPEPEQPELDLKVPAKKK